MLDGSHYFECRCGSDEHTLRFTLDIADLDYKEIYSSVFLNQWRPWWKRVWAAIRYVFGYKCKYGHWDCWTMDENDATRLRDMCEEFINATKNENH